MANKVKEHAPEVTEIIHNLAVTLYAEFCKKSETMSNIAKKTGLSTNSIKSIFRGETANIASYIAIARSLGLNLGILGSDNVVMQTPGKKEAASNSAPVFQGKA